MPTVNRMLSLHEKIREIKKKHNVKLDLIFINLKWEIEVNIRDECCVLYCFYLCVLITIYIYEERNIL